MTSVAEDARHREDHRPRSGRRPGGAHDPIARHLNPEERKTMGDRVRAARWAAGLTYLEAAAAVNRNVNSIIRYEHGGLPEAGTRDRLAALYGIEEPVLFAEYKLRAAAVRVASRQAPLAAVRADRHISVDLLELLDQVTAWFADLARRLDQVEFETHENNRYINEHIGEVSYPDGFAHAKTVYVDGVEEVTEALGSEERLARLERRLEAMCAAGGA